MMNRYLTTPIYYANGAPHLGHAYTTLVADCCKRFFQLCGDDVLLATGSDEHGQKIERTAAIAGQDLEDFVASRSNEFETLWQRLQISVDLFERTSSPTHKKVVAALWTRLVDRGDIYKGYYEGLYCVGCEQYYTSGSHCLIHRVALEQYAEPSYFFRLSAYQARLIDHIESNPEFIVPATRRNEVLSFLRSEKLTDLSVSRTSTSWGIPVPFDPEHVIYVWVDALASYLSALEGEGEDRLATHWPGAVHFIGKDILLFHAIYWPALLWSAGLPLPGKLVVNGWLTVEGRKISKSDPATIIDPVRVADRVGVDGLRFYFLKTVRLGQDLDFQQTHLIDVLNADLANNFGNLVSRFARLFTTSFPTGIDLQIDGLAAPDLELLNQVRAGTTRFVAVLHGYDIAAGARLFVELSGLINADFQRREPWRCVDESELKAYLWAVHHCLRELTLIALPLVPNLASEVRAILGAEDEAAFSQSGVNHSHVQIGEIKPVYPRLQA